MTFSLSVFRSRPGPSVVAIAAAVVLVPTLARADCGDDLGALMKKRMVQVTALNQITRTHGGKLEPISACPRLKALAAAESEVVSYMTKNKDWCSLPDDLVAKMSQSRARTASVAVKACDFAVKLKKMQTEQAQQAANQQPVLKLPAGPL